MPAIAHAYRRGATYSWRRRIPQPLCRFCKGEALIVSLGTRDPRRARFLAGQLTAHSDDLFQGARADAEPDIVMTHRQLDGVVRESLLAHLDPLDRVAAAVLGAAPTTGKPSRTAISSGAFECFAFHTRSDPTRPADFTNFPGLASEDALKPGR